MTDNLEDRVRLLEKEIQEKNQLIATLQKSSFAALLFSSYLHETRNRIGYLSALLSNHFEICRKKGINKYIDEITSTFDGLQDVHEAMSDAFMGSRPKNNVSIEECIQTTTKLVDQHLKKSKIILKTELNSISRSVRVPKQQFTTVESELGEYTKINIILPEGQEQSYENTPMD